MTTRQNLEIVARADVGEAEWDAHVEAADEAWLWHRYAFPETLATWPRSTDESVAARVDGRIVGVLPLRRIGDRRLRLLPADVLESHGGPAVADNLGRRLRDDVRNAMLEHARRQATRRTHEIRLTLPPLAPAYRGDRVPLVNPLIALGLEDVPAQTWIVDLSVPEEQLWNGLEGRARTAIRKARKEGVDVRLGTRADLGVYLDLHAITCARTGVDPHPAAYFEVLFERFLEASELIVLVAERAGEVIAARNFGSYKGAGNTWTAAGTAAAGPLGANSLLQWEAMRRLREAGAEFCDSGEAFPGFSEAKQRGLSDFKRSFGGRLYPYYRGRHDLRPRAVRAVDAVR